MIKPWGNFVCVTDPPVDPQENRLNSGIYLPESATMKALNKGIVMSVGPCVEQGEHTPEGFTAGAVVWYAHGDGFDVGSNSGEPLHFIPAGRIVCWEPAPAAVES